MALLSGVLGPIGIRPDPPLTHNFLVSLLDTSSALAVAKSVAISAIADVAVGGFSECSGLEMSMKAEEYQEGGNNGTVLKFPGRVSWSNLTLKKGAGLGAALWEWHFGFAQGKGKRRDGIVMLMNDLHVPVTIWYFRRGLPVKWTGPHLNAAQPAVAIESIEIAHEGLHQLPFDLLTGLAGAAVGAAAGAVARAL